MANFGQPVCIVPSGDRCGEGAVWNESEQALYWCDINRFLIHRLEGRDGSVRSWFFEEPVTAVMLTDKPGTLAVALASRLILWQPGSDRRSDYAFNLEGWPRVRCNDARPDPRGSIWLGSMRNNVRADGTSMPAGGSDGVLFRIDPDGAISRWAEGIGISNTVAWSPDHRRFYFADTLANKLWSYDYDRQLGTIANPQPLLFGFERGMPDGSAVDSEGYIWNCRYQGGCIVRIAPDGGIDSVIDLPVANVTTCTFGGPERKTLFITTAAAGAPESDRLGGGLFALEAPISGLPENKFCLASAGVL